jgi:hypothetical protein
MRGATQGLSSAQLHPAGKHTITGMVAKGWSERQLDVRAGTRYCITPAGEAALRRKFRRIDKPELSGCDMIPMVPAWPIRSQLMRALGTFVIYVTPFLIIGIAVRLLMKQRGVDLSDIQAQARPNRRVRKVFLLGAWRNEE